MTVAEIVVVVAGLVFGYFLVSAFYAGKKVPEKPDGVNAYRRERPNYDRSSSNQGENDQQGPKRPESNAAQEWHAVLMIERSASADQIKDAYRRRIAEYHPDKVAKLGAELRMLAEKKSKEINTAFDQAMKACRYR